METKSSGGFPAELRKVLVDFFLGGIWDERQERTFEILFRLLGHLSRIDGTVSPDERKHASRVMDEIGLPGPLRNRALAAFDAESADGLDLRQELQRYLEVFRPTSPQIATLCDCLRRLAHADGRMDTRERVFLQELNHALGINDYDLQMQALARMPMH